jgi:antagonist of KipI
MSLRICKAGLLDTIQDKGRYGYQHLGINPGGAMDLTAMKIANALVGNEPGEPVIEMHFPAAEILFEEAALIALTGADFTATINGEAAHVLQPAYVQKGSLLRFNKNISGARSYLAVRGGYVADSWLHSCSTHLKVKAGGFDGRALQKNDRVLLKQNTGYTFDTGDKSFKTFPWRANVTDLYSKNVFHFIPGAEYDGLSETSKQKFEEGSFAINHQSDRMGYRLQGGPLQLQTPSELISTAVTRGTIQLLPDGQLIVLMADHQTTGGYPRVGHVISADISSLAQIRAGENISFRKIDIHSAENRLLQQERNLQQLQNACNFRLAEFFNR